MQHPVVAIDLETIDRNAFLVIGYAAQKLIGDELTAFYEEVLPAIPPTSGNSYEDILAIVNRHVCLVDISGTYPAYTIDEAVTMSVIRRMHEQLRALPSVITCLVEDLYPDTGSACGLANYLTLIEQEIARVEDQIDHGEPYQVLLAILQECLTTLEQATIRPMGNTQVG